MCDVPITGHAVERGAPESGPGHGSQGGAQSSSWALQGPGVGDVCGPGPPTVHRRPRWLPVATGSSATEGLNFSLINLFFNVQSASDRMGVGAPTPAQLEPLGSVPAGLCRVSGPRCCWRRADPLPPSSPRAALPRCCVHRCHAAPRLRPCIQATRLGRSWGRRCFASLVLSGRHGAVGGRRRTPSLVAGSQAPGHLDGGNSS